MLKRLEEGRKIAAARRKAGLPTKRVEKLLESGGVSPKIKRGTYSPPAKPRQSKPAPAKPPAKPPAKRSPGKRAAASSSREEPPKLNRVQRGYAKLLGYPVE